MTYREIVHTCSNTNVARAAIHSIGGEFARGFAAEASKRKLTSGALAANLVREFAEQADETTMQGVHAAMHRSEQPILSGLRYILEQSVRGGSRAGAGKTPPAWMIDAARPAA
jgi:hypothetical protein